MAPSDLPPGFAARTLGHADIVAAAGLSAAAGWNQVEADWRIFIEQGCGIAVTNNDGELVATAAMLPYRGRFAWISMVLVAARYRRLGLATWLLGSCVTRLLGEGLVPVLDATPAGRALYLGLGFGDCWGLHRMMAHEGIASGDAAPPAVTVRPLVAADWADLVAYDAAVFGAERGPLLRKLADRLPKAALVAENSGRIAGFLLGRDGRVMNQMGPLVAENETVARALLGRALAAAPAPVAIDLPDRHAGLSTWLAGMGFSGERPWMRMVHGHGTAFDDTERLFAVAGPELG